MDVIMPELQVSEEFLHENKSNLGQFMPISHKRGGVSLKIQNMSNHHLHL